MINCPVASSSRNSFRIIIMLIINIDQTTHIRHTQWPVKIANDEKWKFIFTFNQSILIVNFFNFVQKLFSFPLLMFCGSKNEPVFFFQILKSFSKKNKTNESTPSDSIQLDSMRGEKKLNNPMVDKRNKAHHNRSNDL